MKIYRTLMIQGEKFYQLYAAQRQLSRPLDNLEKRI